MSRPKRIRFLLSIVLVITAAFAERVSATPAAFPVNPHPDATVEWWYANAHVTTVHGHHLAIVCAFFKFGSETQPPFPGMPIRPPSHYLIYAVTDLDKHTQRAYSLADSSMLTGVKDVLLLTGSLTARNKALLDSLLSGHVPKPHQEIDDPVRIHSSPFGLSYGADNSLMSDNDANTAFSLNLGGGRDRVGLTFESHKPPMAVGGNGETGLVKPTDMYYYSLTRCGVAGKIDIGTGWDDVARGQGWIDHQWGSSWTTQSDGWDWWGVQLGNGTDILLFEQRDLATGKAFFPLATFMDRNGRISVTRDIAFRPAARPIWRSPRSGAVYPLQWRLSFPGKHLRLLITPDVAAQEMPILSPGGDIWEGSCRVTAEPGNVHGVAYMELVGYGSPAVGGTTRRF